MNCPKTKELLALVAGQLTVEQTALFEKHLAGCRRCSGQRDEIRAMTLRLRPDPGEFEDPKLVEDVMTLVRLGQVSKNKTPARPVFRLGWVLLPAVMAAALVVVLLWWNRVPSDSTEFVARSGTGNDADRWVSFQTYHTTVHGYQPVKEQIRADEPLAFAYTNRSTSHFQYLMIVAVDQNKNVFWYYPAFLQPGENPKSISILHSLEPMDLPEQIRHPLVPGQLRIFALFSQKPLEVAEVESSILRDFASAGTIDRLDRLNVAETGQQSILLRVVGSKPD